MSRKLDIDFPSTFQSRRGTPSGNGRTYEITVITPIVGGSAKAGHYDSVRPIRASEIRGQLRFWWRATRGVRRASVTDMWKREGEIWGSVENPSPVQVFVSGLFPAGLRRFDPTYGFTNRFGPEMYALFSAKENQTDIGKEGLRFTLSLQWLEHAALLDRRKRDNESRRKRALKPLPDHVEDISKDVECAVWAWLNFGGIGARTRRGCGALFCPSVAPQHGNQIAEWFQTHVHNFGVNALPALSNLPALKVAPQIKAPPVPNLDAWADAVKVLQSFRQGESIGRNPRPGPGRVSRINKPGRSRWPEADSIRGLTRAGDARHMVSITLPAGASAAFPRAELGLPIVFKFIDAGDQPNNSELYPTDKERMASPVILRPLGVGNGRQSVPMALALRDVVSDLSALRLKNSSVVGSPLISNNIRRPQLATYPNSPMGPTSGSEEGCRSTAGSALQAFIVFLRQNGFV